MTAKLAVLICLALAGVGYGIHHTSYKAGELSKEKAWQIKWKQRDKDDETANLAAEQQQRNEERRRQSKTEEIVNDAELEKQKAAADAVTANRTADRLRAELTNIRRQLADSKTSELSANAARRQTAAEAANMLADMYEESDRRAGELAEYADAAASAGTVCERTYNAVTRSVE
ncbi:DUF2514 family protein [Klebsiella sp. WP4-W18-ESBL-05]|uniref:DUF2514 family protein n=1 Tax=Klebsiella sp. WP4-W18-ESBL-05 TaxID=2675713 RepID=UPI001601D027|nr:DUF2514 family protein [Klebsiella sp. WP4-W18-ESBL-05]